MIFQQRWSELSSALLLSIIMSAMLAVGWVLLTGQGKFDKLAPVFFVGVACSWAVLIPNKLWPPSKEDDSWTRRLVLMTLGFVVAILALWLDGYELPMPWSPQARFEVLQPWQGDADVQKNLRHSWLGGLTRKENTSMPILACYLSYFGLMFLILRWWKITETNRSKRVSFKPLFATAFWGYLLLFLLPSAHHREIGFISMMTAAIVVQTASPWKERPAFRPKKRLRLVAA
jgi:hypothetical protein